MIMVAEIDLLAFFELRPNQEAYLTALCSTHGLTEVVSCRIFVCVRSAMLSVANILAQNRSDIEKPCYSHLRIILVAWETLLRMKRNLW